MIGISCGYLGEEDSDPDEVGNHDGLLPSLIPNGNLFKKTTGGK